MMIKQGLDCDNDRLKDLANKDGTLRKTLHIEKKMNSNTRFGT